jgi:hypothetical protein
MRARQITHRCESTTTWAYAVQQVDRLNDGERFAGHIATLGAVPDKPHHSRVKE